MKEYNRETKKWEEKITGQGKFKKRDLCRGGKEHDFLLTLPPYGIKGEITAQGILAYYESEERMEQARKKEDEFLAKFGLTETSWRHRITKYFICSICGKRKYGN